MSLIPFIHFGAGGNVVQLLSNNFNTFGIDPTVYSGLKLDADGNLYERQAGGGWSNIGAWLLSGTNSDFYVVRVIDSGTLTTDDGAGPLVLSSERIYDVQQSSVDIKTASISFEIQNVGTDVLASITYTFRATKEV